jgi:large subunit ribosomal protein L30
MSARPGQNKTLRVRQVRSGIGFGGDQKATLRALGLGRINKVRTHPDNAQIRGMIAKIPHLVVIEGDEKRTPGSAG